MPIGTSIRFFITTIAAAAATQQGATRNLLQPGTIIVYKGIL